MSPRSLITLFLFAALLSAANGCANFAPKIGLPGMEQEPPQVSTTHQASCAVEMRSVSGEATRIELPVSPDMRIEQVLNKSQVGFRRMDVFILRSSPDNPNQHVKLEIRFDRESGKVKWDTDYSIHDGDRVIIKEATLTVFDEAYNTLLGPVMGRIGR